MAKQNSVQKDNSRYVYSRFNIKTDWKGCTPICNSSVQRALQSTTESESHLRNSNNKS